MLALFVPLIISSGGNSGSQATSLLIRSLALREVSLRDWWKVCAREIFLGVTLGAVGGDRVPPHRSLGRDAPDRLPTTLLFTCDHCVAKSDRGGRVWHHCWQHAAFPPPTPRIRSGNQLLSTGGYLGRRNRVDHLFHNRTFGASRRAAVRTARKERRRLELITVGRPRLRAQNGIRPTAQ